MKPNLSQNLKLFYFKGILGCCFVLLNFSCDSLSNDERSDKDLREIYNSYIDDDNELTLKGIFQKNQQRFAKKYDQPNYRFANELSYEFYKLYNCKEKLHFLDSISHLENFDDLHNLNKFMVYYLMAKESKSTSNTQNTIDYVTIADDFLKGNWEKYGSEKKQLKELIFQATFNYNNKDSASVKRLEREVEELSKSDNANYQQLINQSYNIALYYYGMHNDQASMKWVDKALSIHPKVKNKDLYADLITIKNNIFLNLNLKDSIVKWDKKIEEAKRHREISPQTYWRYQIMKSDRDARVYGAEIALKNADNALNYYQNSCEYRYEVINGWNMKANIYHYLQDDASKYNCFRQIDEFLDQCGTETNYFRRYHMYALDSLINMAGRQNDQRTVYNLYQKKQKLDSLNNSNSAVYMSLNDYFTQAESENEELKSNQAKDKSKLNKMLFILLIGSLALALSGSLYLFYLLQKNKSAKRRVQLKSDDLHQKNKHISKRNQSFKTLINRLENSNNSLSDFAYKAAKDIKSPITIIERDLKEMSKYCTPLMEESDRELLLSLSHSTKDLAKMIETLLLFSNKDKNINREEWVSLPEILRKIESNLDDQIRQHKAIINYPASIPVVLGNNVMIEKLFQNLISNAIKFHHEYKSPKVELFYKLLDHHLIEIVVKDNGIGIPKSKHEVIFQIFHKIDEQDRFEGNGIGLSICKKIVNEFGGQIWVESTPGKGSSFHVVLQRPENLLNPEMQEKNVIYDSF